MRLSLFEKLKSQKLSYIRELSKIYHLIKENSNTEFYFEMSFKMSPYSMFYSDFNKCIFDIFENTNNSYTSYDYGFDYLISCTQSSNSNLTLDSFLDYLELFKTLERFGSSNLNTLNAKQIIKTVDNDIEKLGYKLILDKTTSTYKAVLIHPIAEVLMTHSKGEINDKITKYLSLRPGRVNEKRSCLKDLADDVELICKKYSNISEYKKLGQFIQCVRHTKDNPVIEFPFYYKDEEEWLDKIFEMIIGILSFSKTKTIVKEILDLENKK